MNQKYFKGEIWKPVPGYETLYLVSSYGRIKALNYYRRGETKIMPLHARHNNYIKVRLVDLYGIGKCFRVHRIVALAFLGVPEIEQTQVNHKNGNKQDNRIENLEWCTPSHNMHNPITRQIMSLSHSNPSAEIRRNMSKAQLLRFKREKETHTGRYASLS